MSVAVNMPQLGESVTEGTVTRWLKKEGEHVTVDEPLLEVSTDKVDTEIPSPATGILRGIAVDEDETVAVGAQLAVIEEQGADAVAPAPAAPEPTTAPPAAPPAPAFSAPPPPPRAPPAPGVPAAAAPGPPGPRPGPPARAPACAGPGRPRRQHVVVEYLGRPGTGGQRAGPRWRLPGADPAARRRRLPVRDAAGAQARGRALGSA